MTTPADAPSDAQLIARTREGDMNAYDELYRRHFDDASRVARIVTNNSDEAQDVVAEAFTRVLTRLREGGGPDTELTPYLRTVVRRLAIDRHRFAQRGDTPADPSILEILPRADDPMARATDRQLVRQAFETLPDRWQQVLWHTEIEGRSAASLAATLGSTPNAVAALAYRAREGLRQAYLAVNLSSEVRAECRPYAPKVAAYVRGTLSAQHTKAVTTHLSECQYCRERRDELLLLVSDLRGTLWPALLLPATAGTAVIAGAGIAAGAAAAAGGGAATNGASAGTEAAVLTGAGVGAGAAAGGGAASGAGTTAAAGAAAGGGGGASSVAGAVASPGRWARLGGKTLAGAAGVAAAGVIIAGAVMMLNGSDDPPENRAAPTASESADDPIPPPAGTPDTRPEPPNTPDSSEPPATEPAEPTPIPSFIDLVPPNSVPVNQPSPASPTSPETPFSPDPPETEDPTDDPDDPTTPPPDEDDPESPPAIGAGPQSTTAEAGQPVTLSVQVSGNPAPSLVWQSRPASSSASASGMSTRLAATSGSGWSNVPGATSASLTVTPEPEDNGRQYRVVATNAHGSQATDPATLTVRYAPILVSDPASRTVAEGGDVVFTASAKANPAPSNVTWQRRKAGGSWESAGSGGLASASTKTTLELSDIDRDLNDYEYRAVFTNPIGSANSSSAGLTVQWKPDVASHPKSTDASTGGEVTFEATAQKGNPGHTLFVWQERRSGGRWQDLGGWQPGTTASRRVAVNELDQDGSEYRVVFKNDVGTTESEAATLRVHSAGTMSVHHAGWPDGKQCVQPVDGEIRLGGCSSSDPPIWKAYADNTVRWAANGRCLGVSFGSDDTFLTTHLSTCGGAADQQWFFNPTNANGQQIKNGDTTFGQLCLDVRGGVSKNGRLIAFPCHGGANQQFRFEPTQ